MISNLDIKERRVPQDGVFRVRYFDKTRAKEVGLEKLNHSPHVLAPVMRLLKSAAGMVLVSGPSGSGKITTLYGALQYLYNPGLKIIMAEDPIEYSLPGIIQAHQKMGLTFANRQRSFLRLDPKQGE